MGSVLVSGSPPARELRKFKSLVNKLDDEQPRPDQIFVVDDDQLEQALRSEANADDPDQYLAEKLELVCYELGIYPVED